MLANGKVKKGRAADYPEFTHAGWRLQYKRAFSSVCPSVLAQLKPLPKLERTDFKEYLAKAGIHHEV